MGFEAVGIGFLIIIENRRRSDVFRTEATENKSEVGESEVRVAFRSRGEKSERGLEKVSLLHRQHSAFYTLRISCVQCDKKPT